MSEPAPGTKYLGVGVSWAASVGLFLWLGSLVDGRLGSKPVFTLIGAGIGIVAGFVWLLLQVQQDAKAADRSRKGDDRAGG